MPFFDHLKQWLFKNYNWLLRNAVKSGHKWQRISHCKRASDASLLLWESKGGGLKTISYTVHLLTKQTASLQKEHFLFAFLRIKTFLNSKASYKLWNSRTAMELGLSLCAGGIWAWLTHDISWKRWPQNLFDQAGCLQGSDVTMAKDGRQPHQHLCTRFSTLYLRRHSIYWQR